MREYGDEDCDNNPEIISLSSNTDGDQGRQIMASADKNEGKYILEYKKTILLTISKHKTQTKLFRI